MPGSFLTFDRHSGFCRESDQSCVNSSKNHIPYLLCELLLLLLLLDSRLFNLVPQADGNPLGGLACKTVRNARQDLMGNY